MSADPFRTADMIVLEWVQMSHLSCLENLKAMDKAFVASKTQRPLS